MSFCLQSCLNSYCRDSTCCWKHFSEILVHIVTQLLQICQFHIHDVKLLFHHIFSMIFTGSSNQKMGGGHQGMNMVGRYTVADPQLVLRGPMCA